MKEYPNESAILSHSVPIRGEAECNLWCTYVYARAVSLCVRVRALPVRQFFTAVACRSAISSTRVLAP